MYMKLLNKEQIAYLIKTANSNCPNQIFVMTEDDIKYLSENRYESIDVVIRDDLLQSYIETWFDYVTKAYDVNSYMNANRLFMNITFKNALSKFIRQLDRENIGYLIRTGSCDFVNTMFVMIEDDIHEKHDNRFECVGIVIPSKWLHHYIERFFDGLTNSDSVIKSINGNRCLIDVTFWIALKSYTKHLLKRTSEISFKREEEICQ